MKSGLYYIKNLTNGRFYIGQSQNTNTRISQHKNSLNKGYHSNQELQNDWNLAHNFTFGILASGPIELVKQIEENLIASQTTNPRCYNVVMSKRKRKPVKKPIWSALKDEDVNRFFNKTKKIDQCIIWEGHIDRKGHPRFSLSGQNLLASYVSWAIKNQDAPKKYIKHTCGHNHCVNPDHLVEQDNEGAPIRISFVEIQAKKKSGLSTTQIAQELGCDPTTVRRRLKAGY